MSMAGVNRETFKSTVDEYRDLHSEGDGGDVEARKASYTTLVNQYYDLVTDFYEFGWGQSFHFAPRRAGESFKASLGRHERLLADRLGLRPGLLALDIGCGVGGPMREIARYSGARVVGINNNAYQIERGEKHSRTQRMEHLTSFQKADFMQLPFADESVDAIYTIEASCHAPDKAALFSELRRVLKPGGRFAGYEWCLTDLYRADSARHRQIKKDIEEGDGLPDIAYTHEVDSALEAAGLRVLDFCDIAPEGDPRTPWYHSLSGGDLSISSLPRKPLGRVLTNAATRFMERVGIAPEGTSQVSDFLNTAADALVAGGETGVFTPMYYFLAQKPAG
jgi:sterol 24-C-methyltransferase